jgi:hypothetical protein
MQLRRAAAAGAAVAVALSGAVVLDATVASAAYGPLTITAHITKQKIRLSQHSVHAGTILFRAVSDDGRFHQLQIARLRGNYTLQQANRDLGKAFRGDVKAIRRVDHGVAFRGGAPAHKSGYPGTAVIRLTAGHYYLLDQDGQGLASLNVHGKAGKAPTIKHDGEIIANSYGFQTTRLPSSGAIKVRNVSDQPHFVQMERVKDSTTRRTIQRYIHHPSNGKPSWALDAGTDSSVVSPYRSEILNYRLPAGKYLIACFWPDDDTGMPHFFMGMWKLVRIGGGR